MTVHVHNSIKGFLLAIDQNTREAAKTLKNMHIHKAMRFLTDVMNKKQIVPYRRFKGDVGRKAQV